MMRRNPLKANCVSSILIFILFFFIACDKKEILEPPEPELPALTDPIPYETLGSGTIVFERTGPYPGEYSGCYVIDVDQRKAWSLNLGGSAYCVSPDGKKIAFTKYSGSTTAYDVYVVNIDGTDLQILEAMSGQDRYPSWTPDSKKILFWIRSKLYMKSVSTNSNDLVEIMEFPLHPPSGRFSVSIENKISYVSNTYHQGHNITGLYIMSMDGSDKNLLVTLPDDRKFESPVFSPDGEKIAFLSVTFDSSYQYKNLDIFLVDKSGENLVLVSGFEAKGKEWAVNGKTFAVSLAWSPDGSKLLFNIPEDDFVSHIYVMNSDGTGLTQVTSAEGVTDRCVSWGY